MAQLPRSFLISRGLVLPSATPAEMERAEFMVCANITMPLIMADNETGPCRDCGDMLQWRPNGPKKPPRLCLDCTTIRTLKRFL